ncbi:aldehyde dehydrogenase family protein [Peribacillus sp. NPDC097675]|uniref:aldehyde dehydrogenase family protein n=1 Tax=Peribacillus sp. NPDC097675 TaxID=3390618 RepID=UPI003D028700
MSVKQIDLWINNDDVKTDIYTEVLDPGHLTDVVGSVAQGTPKHVDQAVRAAHQAFLHWRDMKLEKRSQMLLDGADLLQQQVEKYAPLLTRETGMLHSACVGEVFASAMAIRGTVELAGRFLEPKRVENEHTWISVEKSPLGVIVALTPWNVPMAIVMSKLAPILVTGNTVVIKPSPNASMAVTLALKEISSIFPPGVINVIHGDANVGEALTTHSLVRKITLTGGERTAMSIMKSAAESLKPVHFELGGNDPAILLEDVNLEKVIPEIAELAFRRSGQVCVATKRIYIPETLYDEACMIFKEHVNQYKIGHGLNEETTFGPVNNKHQYTFVKGLIERARENSTVVELGKKLEPDNWENGYYIHPTVIMNVKNDQEIVMCEQFGPVVPLVSYRKEAEVINMANSTEYGLGSTIWTSDFERGLTLARQMDAGMTGINGSIDSSLGMNIVPFGGVKKSGIGWERGESGLNEFVNFHGITYHKTI